MRILLFCGSVILMLSSLFAGRAEAQSSPVRLKILSYNVLEGFRNDNTLKEAFGRWVDTLRPDVIAFQEMQHMTEADFRAFALELGFPHAVLLKEKGFPVALASRYPITNVAKVDGKMHHGYIYGQIRGYHFFVVHLSPFSFLKRKWEIGQIMNHIRSLPRDARVLVMGDFNALSPQDSSYYENGPKLKLTKEAEARDPRKNNLNGGRLDYSVVQTMVDGGFRDSWKLFHAGYQRSAPSAVRFHYNFSRIDYIWVSNNLVARCQTAYMVKDPVTDRLSDHYPVVLVLDRNKQSKNENNTL